jgi:hypothetical protein
MADLLRDIAQGTANAIYKFLDDLPEMAAAVHPILPREVVTPVAGHYSALRPYAGRNEPDHLVDIFADKIPKTRGAPVQIAV